MPQIFQVLQCFSCHTFQVQQAKKSNKWTCKMCGEKQSVKKVFGEGSGADCRIHVQDLNRLRGELETQQVQYAESHVISVDTTSSESDGLHSISHHEQGKKTNRWSTYIKEDSESDNGEEDDHFTLNSNINKEKKNINKLEQRKTGGTGTDINCRKRFVRSLRGHDGDSCSRDVQPYKMPVFSLNNIQPKDLGSKFSSSFHAMPNNELPNIYHRMQNSETLNCFQSMESNEARNRKKPRLDYKHFNLTDFQDIYKSNSTFTCRDVKKVSCTLMTENDKHQEKESSVVDEHKPTLPSLNTKHSVNTEQKVDHTKTNMVVSVVPSSSKWSEFIDPVDDGQSDSSDDGQSLSIHQQLMTEISEQRSNTKNCEGNRYMSSEDGSEKASQEFDIPNGDCSERFVPSQNSIESNSSNIQSHDTDKNYSKGITRETLDLYRDSMNHYKKEDQVVEYSCRSGLQNTRNSVRTLHSDQKQFLFIHSSQNKFESNFSNCKDNSKRYVSCTLKSSLINCTNNSGGNIPKEYSNATVSKIFSIGDLKDEDYEL